mgnify:CR=1 FL=1
MADDKILDKVRALLAKAAGTEYPAEAEAFLAKAEALMARHAIAQRARTPQDLLGFGAEGWGHDAAASTPDRLVFRRKQN